MPKGAVEGVLGGRGKTKEPGVNSDEIHFPLRQRTSHLCIVGDVTVIKERSKEMT